MPTNLIKTETGEELPVRDDQVHDAVSSGAFAFHPDVKEVPVVAPDGTLGSIPVAQAGEAFKQGYRLSNIQSENAAYIQALEQSREKNWGDHPIEAALLGGASGYTAGGSDLFLRGLAAATGKPGILEGAQQVKERNPIVYTAANVAGAIGSPVFGAVESKLIQPGEALLKGAVDKAIGGMADSLGKSIVGSASDIGIKALGSSLGGVMYGGDELISEAALGDPALNAEHISSVLTNSALFGGILGGGMGALGEGYQGAKFLVKAVSDKVQPIEEKVANKFLASRVEKVRELAGDDAAQKFQDLASSGQWRAALDLERPYVNAEAQAVKTGKQIQKEAAESDKNLRTILTGTAEETKRATEDIVDAGATHVVEAANKLEKFADEEKLARNSVIESAKSIESDGSMMTKTDEIVTKVQNDLKMLEGNSEAQGTSRAIDTWKQGAASDLAPGTPPGMTADVMKTIPTAGDEAQYALRLRQQIGDAASNTQDMATKDALWNAYFDVSKMLKGETDLAVNPAIKNAMRNYDQATNQFMQFRRNVGSAVYKKIGGDLTPVLDRVAKGVQKPETRAAIEDAFKYMAKLDEKSIEQLQRLGVNIPERQQYLEQLYNRIGGAEAGEALGMTGAAVGEKQQTLNVINQTLSKMKAGTATPDEIMGLASKLGIPESVLSKRNDAIRKLADFKEYASPVDALAATYRAAGKNIDPVMQDMLKHQDAIRSFIDVKNALHVGEPASSAGEHLTDLAIFGSVLHRIPGGAPVIGAAKAATVGYKAMKDPIYAMQMLRGIEKATTSIAKMINTATDRLVGAVSSTPVSKAAKAINAQVVGRTIQEQRKAYPEEVARIKEMQDPNKMLDAVSGVQTAMGHVAPKTAQATSQILQTAAQFLNSKIPADPTAANQLFAGKSTFIPSDADLTKWNRYVSAVANPQSVIEGLSKGAVSIEGIETLKAVYPTIYQNLQKSVMNAIVEKQPSLSYKTKMVVSQMFGIPADATLNGAFIQSIQAGYAPTNNGDQGGRPKTKSVPPMETLTQQSEASRITNKEK